MADYYPLIARAIAGLDPGSPGEARRALYERARTALIGQLRNVQPPLSEAEITRERLALEDAVRRVEADAAKRARPDAPRSAMPPQSAPVRRDTPRPGDALRESVRSIRSSSSSATSGRPDAAPLAPEPRLARNLRGDAPPPPPRSELPRAPAPPPRDMRPPEPRRNDTQMLDEWTQQTRAGAPSSRRLSDEARGQPGVRGLRDVVADAEDLGRSPRPAPRRPAVSPPSARQGRGPADLDFEQPPRAPDPYSYDESLEEAGGYQQDHGRVRVATRESREGDVKVRRGFPVKGAIVVGLLLVALGGALWVGPKVYRVVRSVTKPATPVEDTAKDTNARPKITDRVGQAGQQVAPVAQRVVLYDEDPSSPQGKQYVGSVIWRTEQVKVPAGQPPDIGVRADIEIPERQIKMSFAIRRNTDASLPASHTAELTFVLPPDFGTTVANVPGVLMKSNEQSRGTPLAGLAVKVTDGFFLVGLSNVEADKARNLQLLKERSWFDVPVVYANQRRSIIAIEKGAPGERAFNEAFTAWGQ
ncbi:MAG: hypothetical protein HY242_03635 [Afipia sp.]|nr:hypothetical protein [Afipia sp.]